MKTKLIPVPIPPEKDKCTGCLFQICTLVGYGCEYLHTKLRAGGEYANYAYKDKKCPFLKD